MKKQWILALMPALLCFAACSQDIDEKASVPEKIPEEVTEYGDEGVLLYGEDEVETSHTFIWSAKDSSIVVNVNINTQEAVDRGDWEMGHFLLPSAKINEFLSTFVGSELDESTFYAIEPDGTQVEEMTSYKPGMWINLDSHSDRWSNGVFYWQWYVWGGKIDKNGNEISYDYDYTTCPGRLMIGTNPGNLVNASGKTVTSRNVIIANGKKYDFIVNVKFSSGEIEIKYDDDTPGATEPKGEGQMKSADDFTTLLPHTLKWDVSSTAIDITANMSLSAIDEEAWGIAYFKIDPEVFNKVIGKDITTISDEDFYPVDLEGNKLDGWTSYKPGMWIGADGQPYAWDGTPGAFWQYHVWGESKGEYYDFNAPGAFLIGQYPSTLTVGDTLVSKAVLCGIPMTVTIIFGE